MTVGRCQRIVSLKFSEDLEGPAASDVRMEDICGKNMVKLDKAGSIAKSVSFCIRSTRHTSNFGKFPLSSIRHASNVGKFPLSSIRHASKVGKFPLSSIRQTSNVGKFPLSTVRHTSNYRILNIFITLLFTSLLMT